MNCHPCFWPMSVCEEAKKWRVLVARFDDPKCSRRWFFACLLEGALSLSLSLSLSGMRMDKGAFNYSYEVCQTLTLPSEGFVIYYRWSFCSSLSQRGLQEVLSNECLSAFALVL
jgi:hypothetical protein